MTIEEKAREIFSLYGKLQRINKKINIKKVHMANNIPSTIPSVDFLEKERDEVLDRLELFIK